MWELNDIISKEMGTCCFSSENNSLTFMFNIKKYNIIRHCIVQYAIRLKNSSKWVQTKLSNIGEIPPHTLLTLTLILFILAWWLYPSLNLIAFGGVIALYSALFALFGKLSQSFVLLHLAIAYFIGGWFSIGAWLAAVAMVYLVILCVDMLLV